MGVVDGHQKEDSEESKVTLDHATHLPIATMEESDTATTGSNDHVTEKSKGNFKNAHDVTDETQRVVDVEAQMV